MDFRLEDAIHNWLVNKDFQHDTDQVSVAGAIKDLVSGSEGEKTMILKQIELSVKLHGTKRVILMNHTDCGGYGGKKAFDNNDKEEDCHLSNMKQAAEIIKEKWPNLEIMLVLACIEGEKVSFKEF